MMLAKLYTVKDVAQYFGRTEDTVRRWIAEGKFPNCRKVGRAYYIKRIDVEGLLGEIADNMQIHFD